MESTETVISPRVWKVSLLLLAGVTFGVGLLALLLALGWQRLPQNGTSVFQLNSAMMGQLIDPSNSTRTFDGLTLAIAPLEAPTSQLPATATLNADFGTAAAWGLMNGEIILAVANDGHALAGAADSAEWRPFIHVQSDFNQLYFHYDQQRVTLRVNEEIVWEGTASLNSAHTWSLLYLPDAPPDGMFFDLSQPR